MFVGYIVGASIFALVAVQYGRTVGMAGWFAGTSSGVVGMGIVYMIVSFSARHRDPDKPGLPTDAPQPDYHFETGSNYVPPVAPPKRKYQSVTRRTLNAIKVFKPKEHWRVEE